MGKIYNFTIKSLVLIIFLLIGLSVYSTHSITDISSFEVIAVTVVFIFEFLRKKLYKDDKEKDILELAKLCVIIILIITAVDYSRNIIAFIIEHKIGSGKELTGLAFLIFSMLGTMLWTSSFILFIHQMFKVIFKNYKADMDNTGKKTIEMAIVLILSIYIVLQIYVPAIVYIIIYSVIVSYASKSIRNRDKIFLPTLKNLKNFKEFWNAFLIFHILFTMNFIGNGLGSLKLKPETMKQLFFSLVGNVWAYILIHLIFRALLLYIKRILPDDRVSRG